MTSLLGLNRERSLMFHYGKFPHLIQHFIQYRQVTFLGGYGGDSCKPVTCYGSGSWMCCLKRPRPAANPATRLTTKTKWVNGISKAMKDF